MQASPIPKYGVPDGIVGLTGPVRKPAPGTLPLRGDLAHIALAGTHLAAHYVVPSAVRTVEAAPLLLQPSAGAKQGGTVDAETELELLDVQGDWAWVTHGPEGPSGYVEVAHLNIAA